MPEDQKPFVHQDGTTAPDTETHVAELLQPGSLAALVRHQQADIVNIRELYEPEELAGAEADISRIQRTIQALQLLQEPRVNMTVAALKLLVPSMQALVSDVAIALATNPHGQQNLANALRKLIEGRS